MLRKLRGYIFDLDGTLVDSRLDFAAIRREAEFPPSVGLLEHLETLRGDDRELANAVIHRHEMLGARVASWMQGAPELLSALDRAGMPLGIVTRNSRTAARLMMESLDMPALDLVAREDAPPKPQPDGLITLAERWGIPPDYLIYVGDHLFDLQAAKAAGMLACWYAPQGGNDYAKTADLVIRDLRELCPPLLPAAQE